ncbi:DMT family transporter [Ostreibacterium oceani]|uniref:EamA family transporter n=1 Tax=Ostreibacterium oceani TaxID=2654998 RepID=A0A6N7F1B2_9GAMM|nr:DMT family transporter [Ostreibacterium oceani]MPV86578.1 EamA family transporter [Ostreibacterium oceani]
MRTVAALLAVLFWSSNALAAKFALVDIDVFQILFFQFSAAFFALLGVSVLQKEHRVFSLSFYKVSTIIIGTMGVAATIFLQYLAFSYGSILENNLIAYSWPLFVSLGAVFFLRGKNTTIRVFLALMGFVGTLLLLDKTGGFDAGNMLNLGALFAFASAITMAVYSIKASTLASPQTALIPATFIGAVFSLVCLFFAGEFSWTLQPILISIYIGIGPMALGYYFWTYAMSGDGASRLAPLGYATPLLSTIVLLLSGEAYTERTLLGMLIVLLSTTMTLMISRKKIEVRPGCAMCTNE